MSLRALGCRIALGLCLVFGLGVMPDSVTPSVDSPRATAHGDEHLGLTAGYRLADHWKDRGWTAGPLRFGEASDVASNDDWTFVLDRRRNAIHLRSADGSSADLLINPSATASEGAWQWIRIDTGVDGRPHLLARSVPTAGAGEQGNPRYRVDVIGDPGDADWLSSLSSHDLGPVAPERYVDLSVAPDGRVFVVRTDGNVASRGDIHYAVDILDPSDEPATVETWHPENLYIPLQIEIDTQGAIYLIDQFPHTNQSQPPGTVDGIHVYAPNRNPQAVFQFSGAMDLAVSSKGEIYVTRNREIYRLGDDDPLFVGPAIQKNPYQLTPLGVPEMFSLDVGPGDILRAAMKHCSWQGLLEFEADSLLPGSETARFLRIGQLDRPELAGPMHPYRADADRGLRLLQARYDTGAWPELPGGEIRSSESPFQGGMPVTTSQRDSSDPQSIQSWSRDGELGGQSGACGVWNAPFGVRDVAVDGGDVWSLDFLSIKRRASDPATTPPGQLELEPEATFGFEIVDDLLATPHLLALAASEGQAAVLDTGSQSVVLVDRRMKRVASWSYGVREDDHWAPTDLAMRDDLVVLVARGERRVTVFDRQGEARSLWWEDRPIRAVDLGPAESIFVLTDGGWLIRRAVDGERQAMWRVPDLGASARDLTVDRHGRVYVPWTRIETAIDDAIDPAGRYLIEDAGVWVFDGSLAYLPASPGSLARVELADEHGKTAPCSVVAQKHALPHRVERSESVEVELRLDSECAPAERGLRLVLILDSSDSMNHDNGLDRAKQAAIDLLGRLDPIASTEVALIGYDGNGGAVVLRPFSEDLDGARRSIAEVQASGETSIAAGLDLATDLLAHASLHEEEAAVLWITDGQTPSPGDDPARGIQALEQAGIAVYLQLHPFRFIREEQLLRLLDWVGADRIFAHHGPESLDEQVEALYRRPARPTDPILRNLLVSDRLAEGMRYVPGSARPPAIWDPTSRRLTWRLDELPSGQSLQLRYDLRPSDVGSWQAISESASASYEIDSEQGGVGFPNPTIHVDGAGSAVLPLLSNGEGD